MLMMIGFNMILARFLLILPFMMLLLIGNTIHKMVLHGENCYTSVMARVKTL